MFARRLVVGTLESACRAMWGFPPRMIRPMVASMGTAGGLRWFTVNMPRCFMAQRTLGPVRAHLAIVLISLNNGCTYCAYGHAYALELLYLREHDRLFPVDARTMAEWTDLEPRRLTDRLRAALEQAGLHSEAVWADQFANAEAARRAGVGLVLDGAEVTAPAVTAAATRLLTDPSYAAAARRAQAEIAAMPTADEALVALIAV